jgi:hypothetical protein
MTLFAGPHERAPKDAGNYYLRFLGIVLLGYALLGKGFAYVGFPPFYVGEIAFLLGLAMLLRSTGALTAALASLSGVLLASTMVWVVIRTIPFVGPYGLESLRDSVVVLYGGFAFVVIGLVLEDTRRINIVLRSYRTLITAFPLVPVGFILTKYWMDDLPRVLGPGIPLVDIQASAVGTHLAGAAVFVLLGYRRVSWLWILCWFGTLAMVGATNRGATLAVLIPVTFALLVLGRVRLLVTVIGTAAAVFAAALGLEAAVGEHNEVRDSSDRPVSAYQIAENAKSLVGQAGEQTEGTKQWRLQWWELIINTTVHGPHFWGGRGFGLNLADADGFGGSNEGDAPLRSPHNVHMTLLARAGVPGVVLWWLVLICWAGMLIRALIAARARGHEDWAKLFLWPLCYAASIIINATFDVTLEGPMQGIWFWCLFGFGVALVMVYRATVFKQATG